MRERLRQSVLLRVGATIALCLLATNTWACRIPVFRYALERWAPGNLQAIVVHSAPLTDNQLSLLNQLRDRAKEGPDRINLSTTMVLWNKTDEVVNAAADSAAMLTPGEKHALRDIPLPALLLRFATGQSEEDFVWGEPLTADSVNQVIDSPLRQQVVTHLLEGDSAVWVLIECGDPAKDDVAAATLEAELARMEKAIQLPALEELAQEEEFLANATVPLRLSFSLVRIPHNLAEESVFRALLLHSEADLAGFTEPIAVPIYGRGRTYFALVGNGINSSNIESNSRFVCGDCSCQIKDQNPGVDLLLAVDWQSRVGAATALDRSLPELSGIGALDVIDLGTVESMTRRPEEHGQQAAVNSPNSSEPADLAAAPSSDVMASNNRSSHPAISSTNSDRETSTGVPPAAEHGTASSNATTAADGTTPSNGWSLVSVVVACVVALGLTVAFGSLRLLRQTKS